MSFIPPPIRSLADLDLAFEAVAAELAGLRLPLPQAGAVSSLELIAADSYDAAQLQAIIAKLDEVLDALRAASLMAPS